MAQDIDPHITLALMQRKVPHSCRMPDDKPMMEYINPDGAALANRIREDAATITALRAERDALRETLGRWQSTGCPDCSGDCGSANPPVVCCIMQQTSAALTGGQDGR